MANSEQVEEPATPPSRAQQMLLDFLRECERGGNGSGGSGGSGGNGGAGSPDCPVCGYNLKGLTRPICPECGQELMLTVGAVRLRLGWLLVALAPGFFSGIAAVFVLVMIVGRLMFGDGGISLTLNVLALFGWCSGIFAIVLAVKRNRFLAQSSERQRSWALGIWFVHMTVFVLLIVVGPAYL